MTMTQSLKESRNVLLVDDEKDILDVLRFNFSNSGFNVITAASAEDALKEDFHNIHLIILDVMMPGMSGFQLAMKLKENPQTADIPIIFLTARSAREDIIDGLRIGVDDYITKPFSVQELLLRSQAVLRRYEKKVTPQHALYLDHNAKELRIDGQLVPLTRTEFNILSLLKENPGRVYSREQLLNQAWPEGVIVTDRSVDVSIARLRRKLGAYSACIVTRQGYGYCFKEENAEA